MKQNKRTGEDGYIGPVALGLLVALCTVAMLTSEVTLALLVALVLLSLALDLLKRAIADPVQTRNRLKDDLHFLARVVTGLFIFVLLGVAITLAFYNIFGMPTIH